MSALLYVFALCAAIDGDTLHCGEERVRLVRIDSVERGVAGFQAAKDYLQILIEGQQVTCRVRKRDKYYRLLGECSTPTTASLSDAMLSAGLAERYRGRE